MAAEFDEAARLVLGGFVNVIHEAHGTDGTRALRHVLRGVISVFKYIEPESAPDGIVVFSSLEGDVSLQGEADPIEDFSDLQYHGDGWLVVEALADGTARMWSRVEPDLAALSNTCVVYLYNGGDYFFVKGERYETPKGSGRESWFVRPVFTDLRKALIEYRSKLVRTCRCHVLKGIWRGDPPRLIMKRKPEATIRNSLEDHLVSSLRDVEVETRPEFIVDESHPVDLHVMFNFDNRVALIEIKWMGLSVGEDGRRTRYSDARAREGAAQLAKYLDDNRTRAGNVITKGYLVVLDGRRRAVKPNSISTNAQNGMYYANREIKYEPEFHRIRRDFATPIRMFVEPVISAIE